MGWEASINETLDVDDIRLKFKNEKYTVNPIDNFNLSENNKLELNNIMKKLFDYSDLDNYGIKKLDKYINIDHNPFQTLYNILVHNTQENRKNIQLNYRFLVHIQNHKKFYFLENTN